MSQQEQVAEKMEKPAGVQVEIGGTSHPTSENLGPKSNITYVPKTDTELEENVDAILELIEYLHTEKVPTDSAVDACVVFDSSKIGLSDKRQYREGFEFTKTKHVLGTGLNAGDVILVTDTKSKTEHAQKTVMISEFRGNEIRCWVDLSENGHIPSLYLVKVDNNNVTIHMEPILDAPTLRHIIDCDMAKICKADHKPFSMYMLNEMLDVVTFVHSKEWLHNDLHADNLMVQRVSPSSLKVIVIDFGMASRLSPKIEKARFHKDIGQVFRMFTGLYTGNMFKSVKDLWESNFDDCFPSLSLTDRDQLVSLLNEARNINVSDGVSGIKMLVQRALEKAMIAEETCDDVMKRVISVLYSKTSDSPELEKPTGQRHDESDNGNGHQHSSRNNESRQFDFHSVGMNEVRRELVNMFIYSGNNGTSPSPPNSLTS